MKIAWLNDYLSTERIGGCQITNALMINKGLELGHKIEEFCPDSFTVGSFENYKHRLGTYDLCIINNINAFKSEIIEYIIQNKKYIRYEHDYGYDEQRLGKTDIPAPEIYSKIFSNSLLNIFLSPLHLEVHRKVFRDTLRDAIYIPSPIEKGLFYPDESVQKDTYLYAGVLMTHKGVHQILDYADTQPKKHFHFVGRPVNMEIVDRIKEKHTYLGEMPYSEMPQLYRKYKYIMLNPQWDEPFGRIYNEAITSGCKIMKFSKSYLSGYESYNLDHDKMLEKCIKAPITFWHKVEKVI